MRPTTQVVGRRRELRTQALEGRKNLHWTPPWGFWAAKGFRNVLEIANPM
jgi:hypothetical protein